MLHELTVIAPKQRHEEFLRAAAQDRLFNRLAKPPARWRGVLRNWIKGWRQLSVGKQGDAGLPMTERA